MLRSAIPIRRAVKMPRTEKLSFLVAFNGPFVPPIKDACDEQPNDRQWQSEDDKRHSGADKHCEHEYPPPLFFLHIKPTEAATPTSPLSTCAHFNRRPCREEHVTTIISDQGRLMLLR
jgi:hypothetical protein